MSNFNNNNQNPKSNQSQKQEETEKPDSLVCSSSSSSSSSSSGFEFDLTDLKISLVSTCSPCSISTSFVADNVDDELITPVTSQLDSLDISYTLYHHEPFDTMEACRKYRETHFLQSHNSDNHSSPTLSSFGFCKNLFVKDKKNQKYLIVAFESTLVGMPHVRRVLDAARSLSMTTPEELKDCLGVLPGCVSPLALVADSVKSVRSVSAVLVDPLLFQEQRFTKLVFHPLTNTCSVAISPQDFKKFLTCLGYKVIVSPLTEQTV